MAGTGRERVVMKIWGPWNTVYVSKLDKWGPGKSSPHLWADNAVEKNSTQLCFAWRVRGGEEAVPRDPSPRAPSIFNDTLKIRIYLVSLNFL